MDTTNGIQTCWYSALLHPSVSHSEHSTPSLLKSELVGSLYWIVKLHAFGFSIFTLHLRTTTLVPFPIDKKNNGISFRITIMSANVLIELTE